MIANPPFFELRPGENGPVARGVAEWRSSPDPGADGTAVWARWRWEGETLTAEVDRHGFFSLFVYEKDGTLALSPSLLCLVAEGCDPALDHAALAVFHRLGLFINDETPLRHVRVLPPGGRLTWRDGRASVTGTPIAPRAQTIGRKAALDGLIDLFAQGIKRILDAVPGPLYLPLTGGRDSRHTLLEMLRQGRAPDVCVTAHHNGHVMPPEALGARAICERHGIAHDVLGYTLPRVPDTARTLAMTSLCADEHAQMLPLYDYFLSHRGAAIDGIAGNTLTEPDSDADTTLRQAEAGDFTAIARGMIAGHARVISQPSWGAGAGPLFSADHEEEAVARIATAIAQHASAPNPVQMFRYLNRMRREISLVPQAIFASASPVFSAYLDAEFTDFCLSLPYSVTRGGQLHNDAIALAFPGDADVPFQEGFATPALRRGSVLHKVRTLRDILRITRALDPQRGLGWARDLIANPTDLQRGPGYTYRLHAMVLDGLDAAKARRVLGLVRGLEQDRPTALVSDRYLPGRRAA